MRIEGAALRSALVSCQWADMVEHVTLAAAFVAGLLSFISPCVLPLVPGYLSFVSGLSVDELRDSSSEPGSPLRRKVLVASLAFVLGFSLVFVTLGASATVVGQFVMERLTVLGKVAGVIIILFGLHTMGLLRIDWLYREKRVQMRRAAGPFGAFFVGLAFAFGWTPCIGPILAGILAIAATQETVLKGVQLLAIYSLGLGIPFILTAVAVKRFFTVVSRIRRYYHAVEVSAGVLLVAVGVLIFTDRFTIIARYLQPYLPVY